jgi:hypothetical protein
MAATFRVLSQRQSTQLTHDGRFIDVMEITFETLPEQIAGTISVPLTAYNTDNVTQLLTDRAAAMSAVQNL